MGSVVTLSFDPPDLAILTLDDPRKGANILSRGVLDELERHFTALAARKDLAGLVIRSGKPGMFIAGADLREFAASLDAPREQIVAMCQHGRQLFQRLSQMPFVTIAAIDGICVGGGAELAIWCDRRIMSADPKAQFGFPEVKLGLFPGWGGTARSARIVGLANAVELVTSGETIDAKAAAAMGLVSDVPARERLNHAAAALARTEAKSRDFERDRRRWRQPIAIDETELMFLGATASAYIQGQTHGQYPAPSLALETMLEAAGSDLEGACQLEAERMSGLFGSPVNRALINVFFLTDRNKKDPGVDNPTVQPLAIQSVSVIGAGIMGQGIAAANVKRQVRATLTDADAGALARGLAQTLEEVSYNKERKGPDVERAVKFAPLLRSGAGDADVANSDLVIEAVIENADIKRTIYKRLEPLLPSGTILASNTSTIPITKLAHGLAQPDRFLGIHFFNPVRRMQLVEVIRGVETSDETVATAVAYAKALGKSPIVVNDGPGFLVNRLLLPFLNEALELISDGAPIKLIERASRDFGMPMGPLALYDMVGLDTSFYAGRVMWEAYPDRITASPILPALMKAGRLGQKSGVGFFVYKDKKGRGEPDAALDKILAPYLRNGERKFNQETVTNRLFLPMVLEATRILEEKLVRDVRDVDLGMIFGLGFPALRRQDHRNAETARIVGRTHAAYAAARADGPRGAEVLRRCPLGRN
jgi:3-hydroxyacyl-CoA dehydrogenase/enoyl-CoA hydratase/3-hydroxybutyryl-CoA epimerase/3-hydroxyacyl-CoA dehydrogenase/enoyl-CoA hydratase/3-hydroxybutyryl-CoA epimerase/enoyl-CoA isomerase